uniref:Nucleotide-diphospho-sugar transferase domain-containing protein n=1 Tax=Globisporangium ultimum (strain ATCC 200006 / CBS 805.95 / DAOM BR144) TaxID=431595 RepID=K3W9G9_GLOUD
MMVKKRSTSDAVHAAAWKNKMFAFFFLIVFSCAFGLMSVASLIQHQDLAHLRHASDNSVDATANLRGNHNVEAYAATSNNDPATTPAPSATPAPGPTEKLSVAARRAMLGDDLSQFECVAWRRTGGCSPDGAIEEQETKKCDEPIPDGISGFCEVRHKESGEIKHVLRMHCDSLRPGVLFKCADFKEMLEYGRKAPLYEHDASFSYDKCQQELVNDQTVAGVGDKATTDRDTALTVVSPTQNAASFYKRGIALVVYEKLFESVFASIRSMREMGCTLPIELWYIASETNVSHPILQTLTREYGAYLREIKDSRASKFYTKIYAVFYSAFDQVLLLDSDNFAVRDPTFLFETKEFTDTGALFWPDFWRAKKTIFNIQPRSFVWDVFDLDFVDMFEQESGQVMIDRRRHLKAMNAMMYYAFHPQLVERLRLVWGDKDLFRFAWMKTKSSFHMIETPPGAAGRKLSDKNVFCGVTMVQHDPSHEIVFLHRNQEKLSSANHRLVWEHVQEFKMDSVSIEEYDVRGANGGRYYPDYKRCYGKDIYYESAFTVTPIAEMPFANLESKLLEFAKEAATISGTAVTPTPEAPTN